MELPNQSTAVIRDRVAPQGIGQWMAGAFDEIWGHMAASGATPTGPPFARYLTTPTGSFEIEAGFPVMTPIESDGRVQPSDLPATDAAITTHVGPYETLTETYQFLSAWVSEHGYEPNGPFWEIYLTDPGEEPDVMKWQTQVVMPIHTKPG